MIIHTDIPSQTRHFTKFLSVTTSSMSFIPSPPFPLFYPSQIYLFLSGHIFVSNHPPSQLVGALKTGMVSFFMLYLAWIDAVS